VNQPPVLLIHRRLILPPHSEVERESGIHPPIVVGVRLDHVRAQIFIGVSVGDGAGVRHSHEKSREVRTHATRSSRKRKCTARILLREYVELLPANYRACCDVVPPAARKNIPAEPTGLVSRKRGLTVPQLRDPARKYQRRRTPVRRVLIVAADSGFSRHIPAVREKGNRARVEAAVLDPQRQKEAWAEAMPPVRAGVDA